MNGVVSWFDFFPACLILYEKGCFPYVDYLFYPATAESVNQNIRIENFLATSFLGSFLKSLLSFLSLCGVYIECVFILACVCMEARGGLWVPSCYCSPYSFEEGFPEPGTYFSCSLAVSKPAVLLSPCFSYSSGAGVRGMHRTLPSLLYGCWDQQLSSLFLWNITEPSLQIPVGSFKHRIIWVLISLFILLWLFSTTVLKKWKKNAHSCVIPGFRGNGFDFPQFSVILVY